MVKDDNDVDSTEDIDNPPNIGGVQLKYGDGDPIAYQEIDEIILDIAKLLRYYLNGNT